jgi:NADH-quinone oxidoreductase subunit M
MLIGGFPLLFGFILLALNQPDGISFFYLDWLKNAHSYPDQNLLFFLLLIGFGVKTPLFPSHTWLPVIAQESLPAIVALIAGLKLGAYGLLRFVAPLAPQAVQEFQWLLLGLGMVGLLYGAFAALSQTNLRRMLAFSSISHVALVVIGIASLSVQGIQGAVFQLLNFTLIASALFLLAGFLHQRIGSTDVLSLGGVAKRMPLLAAFFFFFGIASLGMPGTSGFPAEFLLIISALKAHIGAGLVALFVVVLGAAYFLSLYRRSFLGAVRHEAVDDAVDLNQRERWIMIIFAGLVLLGGLFPQSILNISAEASQVWVELLKNK